MDILMTDDDITLTEDQDLAMVTGREAIAQDVLFNLRTWLGESVYDSSAGVPYLQVIFKENYNEAATRLIFEQQALSRPGVTGCSIPDLEFDRETQVLTASGTLTTIDGEVDFSLITGA